MSWTKFNKILRGQLLKWTGKEKGKLKKKKEQKMKERKDEKLLPFLLSTEK